MASLRDIRKRITSVKSTRQITKAMKMIAAVKLRKAQESLLRARPYGDKLMETISFLAHRTNKEDHPLLRVAELPQNIELVVMTSDRGMCGGFNSNILRFADRWLYQHEREYENVNLSVIGRKARDYYRRRNRAFKSEFVNLPDTPDFEVAQKIGKALTDDFIDGSVDEVYLIYNEFKSAISQKVTLLRLLPIEPAEPLSTSQNIDYIYEPGKDAVLEEILPRWLYVTMLRTLMESLASEQGARMTVMESATNNAGEMIDRLTLQYNRARQAAITKELMEIISGAEALNG